MNNNNSNNGFQYTYSAVTRDEVRRIREKYTGKEEDKLERLRRLDVSVMHKAQSISLVFGIIGALIFGFGLSMCLTDLGEKLLLNRILALIIGIISGIAGGVLALFAYPVHNFVTKREREKIAPEIIRLTDELLK